MYGCLYHITASKRPLFGRISSVLSHFRLKRESETKALNRVVLLLFKLLISLYALKEQEIFVFDHLCLKAFLNSVRFWQYYQFSLGSFEASVYLGSVKKLPVWAGLLSLLACVL